MGNFFRLLRILQIGLHFQLHRLVPRFAHGPDPAYHASHYSIEVADIVGGIGMEGVLVLLLGAFAFGVSACNTVHGIGKDTEKAGEKIQKEADEHKDHDSRP